MGFSSLLLPEAVPRPAGIIIVVRFLFTYSESTHLDIIVVLEGFFADSLVLLCCPTQSYTTAFIVHVYHSSGFYILSLVL